MTMLRDTSTPYQVLVEAAERMVTARILPFTPRSKPAMTTGSMRRMVYRACNHCGYGWSQPSPTGKCPNCHGNDICNTGEGRCEAPYRK